MSNKNYLKILQVIGFSVLGSLLMYWVYQKFEVSFVEQCQKDTPGANCNLMDKMVADFKSVNWFWMLAIVVSFMLSNWFRALRWNMLLRGMGYQPKTYNTFWSTMIGYWVNTILPRIGELSRPIVASRYEKIPFDKVMGTIVVDRVLDVLSLLVIIGITFLLQFNLLWNFLTRNNQLTGIWTSPVFWTVIVLFSISVPYILYKIRHKIKDLPFFYKVENIIYGFWEGVKSIKKTENHTLFFVYSVLIWFLYYTMPLFCFWAFPPTAHLTPMAALVVFVFSAMGILVPTPGGIGAYQYLVSLALVSFYGITNGDAFSFSNIIFVVVTLNNIILGLLGYVVLPILNKRDENHIEDLIP